MSDEKDPKKDEGVEEPTEEADGCDCAHCGGCCEPEDKE